MPRSKPSASAARRSISPSPISATFPTDVDHVLHFAVTKSGKWRTDLAANGEAVGHLMAHFAGVESFLHCSSTAVYAPNGGAPMAEDDPLGDHHHDMMPTYSIAKITAETTARFAATHFGVPTTIARLNVPYGDEGGWPFFHLLMLRGAMPIPVHADGSTYNPIHHDDIVAHLPALLAGGIDAGDHGQLGRRRHRLDRRLGRAPRRTRRYRASPRAASSSSPTRRCPALPSTPPANTSSIGGCTVGWRDGLARLVAANPAPADH